ncbi:hypothetical protein HER10_EVM0009523 [Colletotrichum scovillei]|uniref:uncharacterized protein n=1 Tax=Colletotrichum scovillei TaxID=1209932 RepID=UPI0015C2D3DA|nr:uncharacterized protein HER10_EVM0009523 [Colletotrichum scovillei]KAF4773295.1 hypothetical protein HER10_EVM0009523 [Colletotrichum scovillei]
MGILTIAAQTALSTFSMIPPFLWVMCIAVLAITYHFSLRRHADTSRSDRSKTALTQESKPRPPVDDPDAPVSVNYFPSRECNYACGFCFHTNTSGYILPLDEAKHGMHLLKDAGMRKLNVAGGEPFLHPKFLGELLRYCKEDLDIESISIVSNGSKIQEKWLREYGRYLDILAISCDSFVRETNKEIGRGENGGAEGEKDHIAQVFRIAEWCKEYNIMFKLNTLAPFRWKVFQCLIVEGENEDETRVRDARKFLISEEQWQTFCGRHKHLPCYVPEDNETMAGSYLLLDENLRFLDKGNGPMKKSESLLDVGVKKAMLQVAWDKSAFDKRGGVYEWRKPQAGSAEGGCNSESKKDLEW